MSHSGLERAGTQSAEEPPTYSGLVKVQLRSLQCLSSPTIRGHILLQALSISLGASFTQMLMSTALPPAWVPKLSSTAVV
jgi:hypothetical protein